MSFPVTRKRRLRKTPLIRDLVSETHLRAEQLIYPLFVSAQTQEPVPVDSMPGVYQHTLDSLLKNVEMAIQVGIRSVILFGIPLEKDYQATGAWDEQGIVQQATRKLRQAFGKELLIIADTCLCEYMTHGHCGVLEGEQVLNDPSLDILAKTAVSQAVAGADIIAPSDMMDGRIAVIRESLDNQGFQEMPIMAYSAKYASSFYAPFRDAAESAPAFGDRKSYQMDPRNSREALEEVLLDLEEGADMVMVKPAMAYLDIVSQIKDLVNVPVAAYSVSGEYSLIKAAAEKGWIDERAIVLETLTSIRRAGADLILTYHAIQAANWLNQA